MSFVAVLLTAAAASAPLTLPATRAELAVQRTAIEQAFVRERAACEQRFAITPCLEALRKRRQTTLAPLIQQEHALDAEERRARAAAQVQRVNERELAAAQEEGQRRERLVAAPPPPSPSAPASHPVKARNPADAEQQRRQQYLRGELQAAQRRERTEERQARMNERIAAHEAKAKAKPPAAPLPLPGGSAASGAR